MLVSYGSYCRCLLLSIIGAFIDLAPQSKDMEELLQAIQDRLTAIQSQMEATEACQNNLDAHNDLIQSSMSLLQNQVSTLPPPQSSPFTTVTAPHLGFLRQVA